MSRCRETAGFLFAHPCQDTAVNQCPQCNKPICAKHTRMWQEQSYCITCHKEACRQAGQTYGDRLNPYYYSSFYYHDYDSYGAWDSYSRADRDAFDPDAGDSGQEWGAADWEGDFDAS